MPAVLKPLARLWRYDLPRQAAIAFVITFGATALVGFLFSALDQVDSVQIVRAEVRGARDGTIDGRADATEAGRAAGAEQAMQELDELLNGGAPSAAYEETHERAWNRAVDLALERALRGKLELEDSFDQWEALRR